MNNWPKIIKSNLISQLVNYWHPKSINYCDKVINDYTAGVSSKLLLTSPSLKSLSLPDKWMSENYKLNKLKELFINMPVNTDFEFSRLREALVKVPMDTAELDINDVVPSQALYEIEVLKLLQYDFTTNIKDQINQPKDCNGIGTIPLLIPQSTFTNKLLSDENFKPLYFIDDQYAIMLQVALGYLFSIVWRDIYKELKADEHTLAREYILFNLLSKLDLNNKAEFALLAYVAYQKAFVTIKSYKANILTANVGEHRLIPSLRAAVELQLVWLCYMTILTELTSKTQEWSDIMRNEDWFIGPTPVTIIANVQSMLAKHGIASANPIITHMDIVDLPSFINTPYRAAHLFYISHAEHITRYYISQEELLNAFSKRYLTSIPNINPIYIGAMYVEEARGAQDLKKWDDRCLNAFNVLSTEWRKYPWGPLAIR